MKKYSLIIIVYLILFPHEKANSASNEKGLPVIGSWTELYGTYFNYGYFRNLEKANVDLGNKKLLGYLDSLMTLESENALKPNKYFGGTFSLSGPFLVNLVGLKANWKNSRVPSVSIWAVICDLKGNVIDSECIFNQGENRVYKKSICSVLGTEGRMLVQTLDEADHSEIRYIDWSNIYEDGTPSRYFHCYDATWKKGSGGLMGNQEKLSMPLEKYLSSPGSFNFLKVDYLKTDDQCPKIGSGDIVPEGKFLVQSVYLNSDINYMILLETLSDNTLQKQVRLKMIGCDIYNPNLDKVIGESDPILIEDIQSIRVVLKLARKKIKLSLKNRRRIALGSYYRIELAR